MEVGLVTCDRLPSLPSDDRLLIPALEKLGTAARPVVWSDAGVRWQDHDLLVLRSAWDYSERHQEFLRWLDRVSATVPIWNSPPQVRWNSHKRYLLDLERLGIPIVPTLVFEAGTAVDLQSVMTRHQWPEVVVKPAVSADARATSRVNATTRDSAQPGVDRLAAKEDVLIQPYRAAVREEGELSFVFLDGEFSHMVRKRPAQLDFRVQEKFGGQAEVERATPEQRLQAGTVVEVLPSRPLYARVDMIASPSSGLELVELELIEPSLFLDRSQTAPALLAAGIMRRVQPL